MIKINFELLIDYDLIVTWKYFCKLCH